MLIEGMERLMFPTWLILCISALLIWGAWGLFANLTARYLGGFSALVWEVIGAMMVGGIVLVWLVATQGLEVSARGASFGLATGISYTIGLAFFFLALNEASAMNGGNSSGGNVHTILILTALYPIVAVALNYFVLGDPVSLRQLIGMTMGITGIAILVTS